jgi:hypothetical protein
MRRLPFLEINCLIIKCLQGSKMENEVKTAVGQLTHRIVSDGQLHEIAQRTQFTQILKLKRYNTQFAKHESLLVDKKQ